MTQAYMILDLQFGSTGKGLLAGYLAKNRRPDTVVTAWGPNAGHTYIDTEGRSFVHRMLANGIVSPELKNILIGPGSVVDLNVLIDEITAASDILEGKTLIIHPHAAVVTEAHREEERRNVSIGSTMKGTGAAVIHRIIRNPENMNIASSAITKDWIRQATRQSGLNIRISSGLYSAVIEESELIQIEGAQGFSLSIYHGFYPYTTSRDVTPAQVMADCAIPWSIKPEVIGTIRTYPIRVSNRFDNAGNMIGFSGPGYHDQEELDWENDLGIKPELTTVTKLPRRIFSFSKAQLDDAMRQCSPDSLFVNFLNYSPNPTEFLDELEVYLENHNYSKISPCKIKWCGYGNDHHWVMPYKPTNSK